MNKYRVLLNTEGSVINAIDILADDFTVDSKDHKLFFKVNGENNTVYNVAYFNTDNIYGFVKCDYFAFIDEEVGENKR